MRRRSAPTWRAGAPPTPRRRPPCRTTSMQDPKGRQRDRAAEGPQGRAQVHRRRPDCSRGAAGRNAPVAAMRSGSPRNRRSSELDRSARDKQSPTPLPAPSHIGGRWRACEGASTHIHPPTRQQLSHSVPAHPPPCCRANQPQPACAIAHRTRGKTANIPHTSPPPAAQRPGCATAPTPRRRHGHSRNPSPSRPTPSGRALSQPRRCELCPRRRPPANTVHQDGAQTPRGQQRVAAVDDAGTG